MNPDLSSTLARRARRAWLEFAAWTGWGFCDECDQPRFLARQQRARKRLCLECWDQGFR